MAEHARWTAGTAQDPSDRPDGRSAGGALLAGVGCLVLLVADRLAGIAFSVSSGTAPWLPWVVLAAYPAAAAVWWLARPVALRVLAVLAGVLSVPLAAVVLVPLLFVGASEQLLAVLVALGGVAAACAAVGVVAAASEPALRRRRPAAGALVAGLVVVTLTSLVVLQYAVERGTGGTTVMSLVAVVGAVLAVLGGSLARVGSARTPTAPGAAAVLGALAAQVPSVWLQVSLPRPGDDTYLTYLWAAGLVTTVLAAAGIALLGRAGAPVALSLGLFAGGTAVLVAVVLNSLVHQGSWVVVLLAVSAVAAVAVGAARSAGVVGAVGAAVVAVVALVAFVVIQIGDTSETVQLVLLGVGAVAALLAAGGYGGALARASGAGVVAAALTGLALGQGLGLLVPGVWQLVDEQPPPYQLLLAVTVLLALAAVVLALVRRTRSDDGAAPAQAPSPGRADGDRGPEPFLP